MPGQAQVSTLADVLRLVPIVFQHMGDGTPIMIGAQYLREPGPGSAPRVVLVPEERGRLGPPTKINAGYIASWSHACTVSVRGAEPGSDPARLEPAYVLAARVLAVLKALDPAHVIFEPGGPRDTSPLQTDGPGADVTFTIVYRRNIAQDHAVLAAVKKVESVSPPDPDRPQGDTGKQIVVSVSAETDR